MGQQNSRTLCDEILAKMEPLSCIKYSMYRMAYKVKVLQENLKVPSLRIISGVIAHHCLSISETSFALESCELEAILTDVYFAAQKEGSYAGNVDLAVGIVLNFLLSIYDSDKSGSVSVLSAKTALTLLTNDPNKEKWHFLFTTLADHNGCISPRRLNLLLTQIATFAEFVGEKNNFGRHLVQTEVDKCFSKTPGMLGLSEHSFYQWIEYTSPTLFIWMDVLSRIKQSHDKPNADPNLTWKCAFCDKKNPQGLKFKCTRCWGMMICEKCYLYNDARTVVLNNVYRHKKSHIVKEILDPQAMPSQCIIGIVKSMKKILSFPTNCRTYDYSTDPHPTMELTESDSNDNNRNIKSNVKIENDTKAPRVFTSTVGKARGNTISDPKTVLHDIIIQLECQNQALKSLSALLNDPNDVNSVDRRIQQRVDNHWSHIATQINRLKIFKENLLPRNDQLPKWEEVREDDNNKTFVQPNVPFEVFSPIPIMPKECVNESIIMEHKNIKSAIKAADSKNIDSISNISMSDISTWFANDLNKNSSNLQRKKPILYTNRMESTSEDKFNADLESVASSNNKMKELNADLDSVLDRLQTILTNNFTIDEINFDNTQLQETANEMEGLLGTLIRGVEQRRTIKGDKI